MQLACKINTSLSSGLADSSTLRFEIVGGHLIKGDVKQGFIRLRLIEEQNMDTVVDDGFSLEIPGCSDITDLKPYGRNVIVEGAGSNGEGFRALVDFNDGQARPTIVPLKCDW